MWSSNSGSEGLIQSQTLKLHFPTFEEIGPVVFLKQNNSVHTIKVKRRIDVDFLPFARVSFRVV